MFHPLTHTSTLPKQFTYPFHYEAHPICIKVAKELQHKIEEWQCPHSEQGKMYGVLIVKNQEGQLGSLWAYSGNPCKNLRTEYFVPTIFDVLSPDNFFKTGENELNRINEKIDYLERAGKLNAIKEEMAKQKIQMEEAISKQQNKNRIQKEKRFLQRKEAKETLSEKEYQTLEAKLSHESQQDKRLLKQVKTTSQTLYDNTQKSIDKLQQDIDDLKKERHQKSIALQQRIFEQYQMLNAHGETKNLLDIFTDFNSSQPPAGSGDCAAPRLLQYAYRHQMQPLAMAEFWWGKSPKTVIRKQGCFYPSCRSKCEPILSHMLQGLNVENNPIHNKKGLHVEIIFEDDAIIIINKPAGMLSVPGKENQTSVVEDLRQLRPDLKDLWIAHRLDMATSGLIIVAKNETYYKNIQKQFIERKVKKRYEAILDGIIRKDYGKINLPLRVDIDNRPHQQVCYEHGKPALTIWKVIKVENKQTRISFFPITGRTHQLRVHAAHPDGLNTPIIGDELYGTKSKRLMLHAAHIEFIHPLSQRKVTFESKPLFDR